MAMILWKVPSVKAFERLVDRFITTDGVLSKVVGPRPLLIKILLRKWLFGGYGETICFSHRYWYCTSNNSIISLENLEKKVGLVFLQTKIWCSLVQLPQRRPGRLLHLCVRHIRDRASACITKTGGQFKKEGLKMKGFMKCPNLLKKNIYLCLNIF